MPPMVHLVRFLAKGRDKGDWGHPGFGLCQVIDAIPLQAPVGRWRRRGYQVIMIAYYLSAGSLEEGEEVSGNSIRERGIPVHLPPIEEIPVDVFLETDGKAPRERPFDPYFALYHTLPPLFSHPALKCPRKRLHWWCL